MGNIYLRILKTLCSNAKNQVMRIYQVEKFRMKNASSYIDRTTYLKNEKFITLGSEVAIGPGSTLKCITNYNDTKYYPKIKIGNNVHITSNLRIQCANQIIIMDNVLIASNVFMIDYNHGVMPYTSSYLENDLAISEGIIIEEGVWIGNNVIILPGVKIGKKSIIGAGSVVTKSIPPYTVSAGNPAQVLKKFENDHWEREGSIE